MDKVIKGIINLILKKLKKLVLVETKLIKRSNSRFGRGQLFGKRDQRIIRIFSNFNGKPVIFGSKQGESCSCIIKLKLRLYSFTFS
jgi:hypothetical protein